jgi:Holliday junction resolvase-like predicted endonuclease
LIEEIKKREDLRVVIEPQEVESRLLRGADDKNVNIKTLLFQTGYLTIKKEESTELGIKYTIDFPNYEVRSAFLEDLLVVYGNRDLGGVHEINQKILRSLRDKDANSLSSSLTEYFVHIPSNLHTKRESYYHSLLLVLMKAVGYEVEGEVHTDKGRVDVVLKKENSVVIVEIKYSKGNNKVEGKLKEAMVQIRGKKYYEKYIRSNPTLLGIVFSEKKEIRCKFESVN